MGSSFSAELELKPRTESGVILAAGSEAGVSDAVSLQLLDGALVFSVDNGAGVERITAAPPPGSSLCDGHWHAVIVTNSSNLRLLEPCERIASPLQLYKTKNVMTMSVDGVSRLQVMATTAGDLSTDTGGPLLLGGLPDDHALAAAVGPDGPLQTLGSGLQPLSPLAGWSQ